MRAGVALVLAAIAVAVAAGDARAEVIWLCDPAQAQDNPCRGSLQTTIEEPDGSSRVVDPGIAADPPIDCFYVYPTVSNQPTTNATQTKDPEVVAIARFQAARYSQHCNVYAPVYRQLTVLSIFTGTAEQRAAGFKIAYADVLEAWRDYLANRNHGRGVVLIGHSQGTRMLRQLIHDEIDPNPDVRRRLVSAILLGGNVLVRRGRGSGGDFQHIPVCGAPAQIGCVVAYSLFNEPPPDNSRFGRSPSTDPGMGLPFGPDYEVVCANPASLDANERRPLTSYLPSEMFPPGLIFVGLLQFFGGPPPSAPTPWLQPRDRYSGRCETSNGANVLMVQPIGNARHLTPSPDATWGLHLGDANLPFGDLVDLVGRQAQAYLTPPAVAKPQLELRVDYRRGPRGCARSPLRVTVTGADRANVRRAEVRLRGRLVARDRRAPFSVKVRLRRGAATLLRVTAVLADGRRVRLARPLRACR